MTDTRGETQAASGAGAPDVPLDQATYESVPFEFNGGGTVPAVGFAGGTMIATPDGARAVETLAAGDRVTTSQGAIVALRHIRRRRAADRAAADRAAPGEARPLRIAAHAFADGGPARDLRLAPGSRLRVDFLGEMLVPAALLFNAATITHDEVDDVDYYELDLETPEAVLADGLAVEAGSAEGVRPRAYDRGPMIEALRLRLSDRLAAAGFVLDASPFADLHLLVDGARVDMRTAGLVACAMIPVTARNVWLVSQAAMPSTVTGSLDQRLLGVPLAALSIDDGLSPPRDIALDDPRLCIGVHEPEGILRWTTGRARLPTSLWEGCEGHVFVRVTLRGAGLPRWTRPFA